MTAALAAPAGVTACWECRHPVRNHGEDGCSRCSCPWDHNSLAAASTPPGSHRLAMIEVAERVFNRTTSTPGLNYVRRDDEPGKRLARRRLLTRWNRKAWPKGLAILTMPSLEWKFEWALLNSRELRSTMSGSLVPKRTDFIHLRTKRTFITAVEREPTIYLGALRAIPGGKFGIAHQEPAPYSSRSLKTPFIARFHLAAVERVLLMDEHEQDVVWLDFNGPLTDARTEGLRRFWREGLVRSHLAVSVLAARQRGYEAADVAQYLRDLCPGSELLDVFHYQSGRSPMSQVLLGRSTHLNNERAGR